MDSSIEAKLNRFSNSVLNDAHKELESLQNEIALEKKTKIETKYDRYLKEAYDAIQECIINIQKKDREKVRLKEFEAKKELLKKREAIIDEVFLSALEKLCEFKESKEYPDWLKEKLKTALIDAGDGEKEIFVIEEDLDILKDLAPDAKITAVSKKEFVGGVRIKNSYRGILVDYSFYELLEEQRADFLKISGLAIE